MVVGKKLWSPRYTKPKRERTVEKRWSNMGNDGTKLQRSIKPKPIPKKKRITKEGKTVHENSPKWLKDAEKEQSIEVGLRINIP